MEDLASSLERIFAHENRMMEEGLSLYESDFLWSTIIIWKCVIKPLLWHGGDLSVLQRIWLEFEEHGMDSEFGIAADNLQRKLEHVARDEPYTPDPARSCL
jgi:hypothetical protein